MSPHRDEIAEAPAQLNQVRRATSKSRPRGPATACPQPPRPPSGPLSRLFALRLAYARIRLHGAGTTTPVRTTCSECCG